MKRTALFATAAGFLLAAGTASYAQTQTPAPMTPSTPSTTMPSTTPSITGKADRTMANKVLDMNVENAQKKSIGDVNAVILDTSGNIHSVVVGVGGFLGLGEREVLIPWTDLTLVGDKLTINKTEEQLKAMPEYKYADPKNKGTVFTDPIDKM